jgi:hypothetical protein
LLIGHLVPEDRTTKMLLAPPSITTGPLLELLSDADGELRSALMCWAVALSAFIALRVPRQVLLASLIIAAITVGFTSGLVEAVSGSAAVSRDASPSSRMYRVAPASLVENGASGGTHDERRNAYPWRGVAADP